MTPGDLDLSRGWQGVPGWMSIEEIQCLQVAASRSKVIVELGSWCGKSLAAIAEAAPDGARIFSFDAHPVASQAVTAAAGGISAPQALDILRRVIEWLKKQGKQAAFRSSDAAEAGYEYRGPPVEFLFIDDDHTPEQVTKDLHAWMPHLAPQAEVLFHDFPYQPYGLPKAVEAVFARDPSTWGYSGLAGSIARYTKGPDRYPSVGIAVATARRKGLERLRCSIEESTLMPVGVWFVAEVEDAWHGVFGGTLCGDASTPKFNLHRVPFSPPSYYAEEPPLNAAADAVTANYLVLLADLVALDPWALKTLLNHYMLTGAPLISGTHCAHDPDNEGTVLYENPPPPHTTGAVRADEGKVYCMLTGIPKAVWTLVNGLDERFGGANGYQDTNLARRIEAATGRQCHVNSTCKAHRLDYGGKRSLHIAKPKLFDNERNRKLDLVLAGSIDAKNYRAWRAPKGWRPVP